MYTAVVNNVLVSRRRCWTTAHLDPPVRASVVRPVRIASQNTDAVAPNHVTTPPHRRNPGRRRRRRPVNHRPVLDFNNPQPFACAHPSSDPAYDDQPTARSRFAGQGARPGLRRSRQAGTSWPRYFGVTFEGAGHDERAECPPAVRWWPICVDWPLTRDGQRVSYDGRCRFPKVSVCELSLARWYWFYWLQRFLFVYWMCSNVDWPTRHSCIV